MTVAGELAEFLTRVGPADLPPQAVDHAAMLIASTLASAALGSGIESSVIIRDLARERGGIAEASLWFDAGPKLPVAEAAQVNAVMSDAAASDDSDLRNIVHAGTTLVSTALAMAERTAASGEDVLAAIVLGYEAAGRIGEAITPGFRSRGFHGCLAAIFAGAVAAGRLLRLDRDADGAGDRALGDLDRRVDGRGKHQHRARIPCRAGGDAGCSSRARGAARISGRREHSRDQTRVSRSLWRDRGASAGANVTRDLGQSWDIITDMAVKLVPGGHPYHALAEAAANAAREGNIAPQDIESITVSRPGFTALTGPLHPTDLIGMAHSPAYFLAAGAADRDFSWVHATAAKIADPVIHQLIDKVRVGPPPTGNTERYRQGATVTIRTTDGRVSTSTVFAPKGAGAGGIAWADIDRKYRALMPHAGLGDQQIEASLAVIHDFRRVAHVSELIGLLHS